MVYITGISYQPLQVWHIQAWYEYRARLHYGYTSETLRNVAASYRLASY